MQLLCTRKTHITYYYLLYIVYYYYIITNAICVIVRGQLLIFRLHYGLNNNIIRTETWVSAADRGITYDNILEVV